MKRLVLIVVASIIAAVAIAPCCATHAASAPPAPKTATTKLHIEGMTCGSCATAVKLVLQKTPGVVGQQVSYEEKQAVVTYDPGKTTPLKIARAIADALSYKVTDADNAAPAAKPKTTASSCDGPVVRPTNAKPVVPTNAHV